MYSILCFGDSNTWGAIPGTNGKRLDFDSRWPGILQNNLANRARVVEEGLGGRTTCFDDPYSADRNGLKALPMLLNSHSPIDLAIIMLGTNDLKVRINMPAAAIAGGAAKLVECCQSHDPSVPEVLLVSPAHTVATKDWENGLAWGSPEKSKELSMHYALFAESRGCHFLDAAQTVASSPIDGVHLSLEAHAKLGHVLTEKVKEILKITV